MVKYIPLKNVTNRNWNQLDLHSNIENTTKSLESGRLYLTEENFRNILIFFKIIRIDNINYEIQEIRRNHKVFFKPLDDNRSFKIESYYLSDFLKMVNDGQIELSFLNYSNLIIL